MAGDKTIPLAGPVPGPEDRAAAPTHAESSRAYPAQPPRLSPGWIRVGEGVHPDHGEPVTYTPGTLLPAWLRELLAAGAVLVPEGEQVFRLVLPARPAPQGARRPPGKEQR